MAVTTADLLSPSGELEVSQLFPGEDEAVVTSRLQKYIDEGALKASSVVDEDERDDAVKAWVYHRAYRAVWLRMNANPRKASADNETSAEFSEMQINSFRELSADYKRAFDEVIARNSTDNVGPRETMQSTGAITTSFTF